MSYTRRQQEKKGLKILFMCVIRPDLSGAPLNMPLYVEPIIKG